MSTLIAKIEADRVAFYSRFFEGVGSAEYNYIDSMTLSQLTNFIEHLYSLRDTLLSETEIKLNGKKYNLKEAFNLKKELDAQLEPFKEYVKVKD